MTPEERRALIRAIAALARHHGASMWPAHAARYLAALGDLPLTTAQHGVVRAFGCVRMPSPTRLRQMSGILQQRRVN